MPKPVTKTDEMIERALAGFQRLAKARMDAWYMTYVPVDMSVNASNRKTRSARHHGGTLLFSMKAGLNQSPIHGITISADVPYSRNVNDMPAGTNWTKPGVVTHFFDEAVAYYTRNQQIWMNEAFSDEGMIN